MGRNGFPGLRCTFHGLGAAESPSQTAYSSATLQDLQDYLQATIMRSSSPEEAFRRFDDLGGRHVEVLRRLTKQIQVGSMSIPSSAGTSRQAGGCHGAYLLLLGRTSLHAPSAHDRRRRRFTLQDARIARDNESIKRAIGDYDEALEAYIPGLMAMASIYWDMSHYSAVERIFRQSAEFCSEHDVWKLNVAHTYFMQDNHYKEAIR